MFEYLNHVELRRPTKQTGGVGQTGNNSEGAAANRVRFSLNRISSGLSLPGINTAPLLQRKGGLKKTATGPHGTCISRQASSWKPCLFRTFGTHSRSSFIKGGDVIRIIHREYDALLTTVVHHDHGSSLLSSMDFFSKHPSSFQISQDVGLFLEIQQPEASPEGFEVFASTVAPSETQNSGSTHPRSSIGKTTAGPAGTATAGVTSGGGGRFGVFRSNAASNPSSSLRDNDSTVLRELSPSKTAGSHTSGIKGVKATPPPSVSKRASRTGSSISAAHRDVAHGAVDPFESGSVFKESAWSLWTVETASAEEIDELNVSSLSARNVRLFSQGGRMEQGGMVKWNQACRLRNLATGRYLVLQRNGRPRPISISTSSSSSRRERPLAREVRATSSDESSSMTHGLEDGVKIPEGRVGLWKFGTSANPDIRTLFLLSPTQNAQADLSGVEIRFGSSCRFQNILTGLWLCTKVDPVTKSVSYAIKEDNSTLHSESFLGGALSPPDSPMNAPSASVRFLHDSSFSSPNSAIDAAPASPQNSSARASSRASRPLTSSRMSMRSSVVGPSFFKRSSGLIFSSQIIQNGRESGDSMFGSRPAHRLSASTPIMDGGHIASSNNISRSESMSKCVCEVYCDCSFLITYRCCYFVVCRLCCFHFSSHPVVSVSFPLPPYLTPSFLLLFPTCKTAVTDESSNADCVLSLASASTPQIQDGFLLSSVSSQEIRDFFYVWERKQPLVDLLFALRKGRLSQVDVPACCGVITDLARFCTLSENKDILKLRGDPIRSHQDLLRDLKVIDVVVAILDAAAKCVKNMMSQHTRRQEEREGEEFKDNKNDSIGVGESGNTIEADMQRGKEELYEHYEFDRLKEICPRAYNLLRLFVWKNGDMQLYLYHHLGSLRKHLLLPEEITSQCIPVILSTYSDNRTLLNSISEEELRAYINLLFTEKSYRVPEFLATFCSVNGEGIKRNQDVFLEHVPRSSFPKMRISDGMVQVVRPKTFHKRAKVYSSHLHIPSTDDIKIRSSVSGTTPAAQTSSSSSSTMFTVHTSPPSHHKSTTPKARESSSSREWVDLDLWFTDSSTRNRQLFRSSLRLIHSLCLGRNMRAIERFRKRLDFEALFQCSLDENLSLSLRTAALEVMMLLFVDIDINPQAQQLDWHAQIESIASSLGLRSGISRKGGLPNLVRFDAGAYKEHCRVYRRSIEEERRAIRELLVDQHVNQFSQAAHKFAGLVRPGSRGGDTSSQDPSSNHTDDHKKEDSRVYENIRSVKVFMYEFLSDLDLLVFRKWDASSPEYHYEHAHSVFVLKTLFLLRRMITLGFFTPAELNHTVGLLVDVLERTSPTNISLFVRRTATSSTAPIRGGGLARSKTTKRSSSMYKTRSGSFTNLPSTDELDDEEDSIPPLSLLLERSERNQFVMDAKTEICRIFELYLNLQTDARAKVEIGLCFFFIFYLFYVCCLSFILFLFSSCSLFHTRSNFIYTRTNFLPYALHLLTPLPSPLSLSSLVQQILDIALGLPLRRDQRLLHLKEKRESLLSIFQHQEAASVQSNIARVKEDCYVGLFNTLNSIHSDLGLTISKGSSAPRPGWTSSLWSSSAALGELAVQPEEKETDGDENPSAFTRIKTSFRGGRTVSGGGLREARGLRMRSRTAVSRGNFGLLEFTSHPTSSSSPPDVEDTNRISRHYTTR